MNAALLAAFLASAGALGASSSPTFTYRYTSFASQSPDAAAKFLIKYMGATPIAAVDADAAAVSTRLERAVRFVFAEGTQHHDVRFVSDSAAPVGAMLPIAEYTATLHDVHRFDVQETWDWFQGETNMLFYCSFYRMTEYLIILMILLNDYYTSIRGFKTGTCASPLQTSI